MRAIIATASGKEGSNPTNLSHLPAEAIDAIRRVLAGETLMGAKDAFEIERSLPAGHVDAALAMAGRLGLPGLLDPRPSPQRDLCMAMIVGRVISPVSKLGLIRALEQCTLARELGVTGAEVDEFYGAMDWLLDRQQRIEDRLARSGAFQPSLFDSRTSARSPPPRTSPASG
jgi:hypothetical protein